MISTNMLEAERKLLHTHRYYRACFWKGWEGPPKIPYPLTTPHVAQNLFVIFSVHKMEYLFLGVYFNFFHKLNRFSLK